MSLLENQNILDIDQILANGVSCTTHVASSNDSSTLLVKRSVNETVS